MLGTANAGTDLTVYTAVEAEYLKKYAARFNQGHPDININWVRHSTGIYTVCHPTATTALKQMDAWLESVAASLKQPFYRTFLRVTIPVRTPAILDISIYLFVSAMTTVSAIVFLYSPHTTLASSRS
jgi:iron(III) transport system permease protein